MKIKAVQFKEVEHHLKTFLVRWLSTVVVLTAILSITHISNFSKYGLSTSGKLHHSYLDYPNEISSVEALKLSEFLESLDTLWNVDKKIYAPFDKQLEEMNEKYWEKEIDVKDRYKKSQVIQSVAKEMGLPSDKFPLAPPHHRITDKIKTKIHKNIAFPPDYLKIKKPPRPQIPQCDIDKLHHHKTTLVHYSTQQYKTTNIKLDGLFSDGGRINVRVATSAEEPYIKHNIKLNLTVFSQTTDPFNHVSISQVENEASLMKSIHINSHHLLGPCLVYSLDIVFPAKLKNYKNFNIKANHANQITGDLKTVAFKKFSVGLGRGAINFKNLISDEIWLGTLNGIILGHYFPLQKFGAASVKGATILEVSPQSKNLGSTIVSLNGPVKATVTDYEGVSKSSRFTVHCWLCQPSVVSDINPQDIHVTSSRRESIKIGYYKERSNAHVNVHSKYGESKLLYV